MRILLITFCLLLSFCAEAQKEDHIWLFGISVRDNIDSLAAAEALDSTWGSTYFDFAYDPPKIAYDPTNVRDIGSTCAIVCDKDGRLLIYTNGQAVYAGDHSIIEDTINYNAHWDNWSDVISGVLINYGLPSVQGALLLPLSDVENKFYIFNLIWDRTVNKTLKMQYSTVHIDDHGESEVVQRDVVVVNDTLALGSMNAVRHANGRDWWVMFLGDPNDRIFKYLFTPEGITLHSIETIGTARVGGLGQMYFSPDGDKMAYSSWYTFSEGGQKIAIMNFDRATGAISNYNEQILNGSTFSHGVSWSPNGRFLYGTDSEILYQYDTWSDDVIGSRLSIEEWDGFEYFFTDDMTPGTGWAAKFGWMGLAPDGKIYITSTAGSSRVMHKINNPNLLGPACDMDQHSVYLPTVHARTMPNFPNFRLGPLDDSPADTLGLDNHPVAKYRYVQDSLEDLRVHFFDLSYYDPRDYEWDFGDGTISDALEPNHTYAEKGVYEVCLTVSNTYDTSTSCKTIMLGTTSTTDRELEVDVSIYPNPTSDYLTINFHNYIALDGLVRFYDVSGREVKSVELNRASTVLDLHDLPTGVYVYKVYDEVEEVYEGKVVVIR